MLLNRVLTGQEIYIDIIATKLTWVGTRTQDLYNEWSRNQDSLSPITHIGIVAYFNNREVTKGDNDQVQETMYRWLLHRNTNTTSISEFLGTQIFPIMQMMVFGIRNR